MTMTSMERLATAMGHREPDRVPFLLPAHLHGARELGLSLREYFSRAEYVAEGQWRLRSRYDHDALMGFMYGAVEAVAWGGEVVFPDDGPPNAGDPPLTRIERLPHLQPPPIVDSPGLQRVLQIIRLLKAKARGRIPIMAAVISPLSLPILQLGFERYLTLMHEQPELTDHLIRINEEFCVAWANAQLEAGASAIVYTDPVSSPTILPADYVRRIGLPVAQRTLARIRAPVSISFASGRCLGIIDDVAQTGAVGVGISAMEDLGDAKKACRGRLTIMGNLNAIEMRHWTPADAEARVREAIAKAGPGGGYVLTDNHGEIPWQVRDEILLAIADAVHRWGSYPLKWIDRHGP